jgi:hypothetical protein
MLKKYNGYSWKESLQTSIPLRKIKENQNTS